MRCTKPRKDGSIHEILGWLAERGYSLIGIYDILHDEAGRALSGDALFARSKR